MRPTYITPEAIARHKMQPRNSKTCGQHCLAMLLGISVAKAIKIVCHEGPTSTKQMVKAFRRAGVECDDRLKRFSNRNCKLPRYCLIHLRPTEKRKHTHWVCMVDGVLHDPSCSKPGWYSGCLTDEWRITSYLEVYINAEQRRVV